MPRIRRDGGLGNRVRLVCLAIIVSEEKQLGMMHLRPSLYHVNLGGMLVHRELPSVHLALLGCTQVRVVPLYARHVQQADTLRTLGLVYAGRRACGTRRP